MIFLTVIHMMDDTIRTEENVEQYLGVSVLGVIPADLEMGSIANDFLNTGKGKKCGKTQAYIRNERTWYEYYPC